MEYGVKDLRVAVHCDGCAFAFVAQLAHIALPSGQGGMLHCDEHRGTR
jgi:hypothetical protein